MQLPKTIACNLIALLSAVMMSATSSVANEPCPLLTSMKTTTPISAAFTQERFVQGLTKPVVSEGRFYFIPQKEIRWETTAPLATVVTINADGLVLESSSGSKEVRANERFKELGRLLLALHGGDDKVLNSYFELSCTAQNQRSILHARPKQRGISRVFSQITLEGETTPDRVEITDGRGDRTVITLRAISDS